MRAIWCFIVVSVAIVYGKNLNSIVILPPGRAPHILETSAKCVEDMKLDKDTFQKYLAWQLGEVEATKKYIFCLGNESGYVTDDGRLIKNEILELVGSHRERVEGVIDECNNLKYDDKYETVYRVVKCFNEKSQILFKV